MRHCVQQCVQGNGLLQVHYESRVSMLHFRQSRHETLETIAMPAREPLPATHIFNKRLLETLRNMPLII